MVKAKAAIFLWRVRGQQSRRPTQADKFAPQVFRRPMRRLARIVFERNDLVLDEAVDPITQVDQVAGKFEIDHGFLVRARSVVTGSS